MAEKINFGDDEKFIAKYIELKSSIKLAKFYNCSKTSVLNHAKEIGLDLKLIPKDYKLSAEAKADIVLSYETHSSSELAQKYNVSRGMITKLWYDNDLIGKQRRIYALRNEDFFHIIDTEEKAYWLGFLMADGCVSQKENGYANSIHIGLARQDRQHLVKFNKSIDTDKPIYDFKSQGNDKSEIEISSNKMFNDLYSLGCVPNKTYKITWVNLDNDSLQFAFIRGYFDGDGSILKSFDINTLYKVTVSIAGYKSNIMKFIDFLSEHNINAQFRADKRQNKYKSEEQFGALVFPNKYERYKFLSVIYPQSAKVYLDRKFILARKYIELFQENPRTWSLNNADYKSGKIGGALQSLDNTEVSDKIAQGLSTP